MSVSDLRIQNMINNNHPFIEKIKDVPIEAIKEKWSITRILCE